ncbi:MAG: peptidylprolyl isomerase [Bacteroidales bacterium]|nr:peptidylprolyl isomerase [Bacteroidales bacterium]
MKKFSFLAIFLLTAVSVFSQRIANQAKERESGVRVEMRTTMGNITLLLYNDTPRHRDNFIKLVNENVYEGLLFHRVIDRFMIQAGDPKSKDAKPGTMLGDGTLGYTVPAEFLPNHFHKRGALCAARQGDQVNPRKESSSCQFYIAQGQVWSEADLNMMEQRFGKKFSPEQRKAYTTVGGTPHLDGDYTVFGEVLKGMEVVDKIAAAPRDKFDRPLEDIRIISVKILK